MEQYFVNTVLTVAKGEIGYQEKASNSQLDDKHANVGNGNYTKYQRDLNQAMGPKYPWCQSFVDWCFWKAYGEEGANYLLCGNARTASTMDAKDTFGAKGHLVQIPEVGDIWWRLRDAEKNLGHVGIIIRATINVSSASYTITTIEGNTDPPGSGGSEWNGNGVYEKQHTISLTSKGLVDEAGNLSWFGRPEYADGGAIASYDGNPVTEEWLTKVQHAGQVAKDWVGDRVDDVKDFVGDVKDFFEGLVEGVQGFIDALRGRRIGDFSIATFETIYKTIETEIVRDEIRTVSNPYVAKLGNNLLTYPSLVESPYIIFTVGDYKFGTYSERNINDAIHVNYPNYIQSMTIQKVNGQVNQYTINLVYQIQFGDDPNLLDRIFSTVGYGKVKISYGDWSSPTFIYKEEEAIITNLTSNVDFGSSRINYTVKCTSDALMLAGGYHSFPRHESMKPSDLISDLLKNNTYGITDMFPGMSNYSKVVERGLIATDDQPVEIEAQNMDVLSYINYLVTCMSSVTNAYADEDDSGVIKDSVYMMSIYDNTFGEDGLNGSYFKVVKINSSMAALATSGVYSVDIGFPTDTLVMGFSVLNNNSWALLYNYSDKVEESKYIYSIDNDGNVITKYSPSIAVSSTDLKMKEKQKTWWTEMTQFPIKAELELKGLVRPAMLMTYIRINALFYGQRHVASGLYTVTKQVDTISGSGYRTKLTLLRIAGDNDYIQQVKTKVTSTLPVTVISKPVIKETNDDVSTVYTSQGGGVHGGRGGSFATDESDVFSHGTQNQINNSVGIYTNGGALDSNTSYSVLGGFKGTKYQCTDEQILGITAGCIAEQGSKSVGVCWEASLICNLTDESKTYNNPYDFINSGWFASRTKNFVKNCAYVGADIDGYKLTEEHFNLVKQIVVYGNRWTRANEHDCTPDILKLDVNGRIITDSSIIKNKKDSTVYIPGVTIIYNRYESRYRFIGFPGNDTRFDPFGVKF